jgi:hypothetical protein
MAKWLYQIDITKIRRDFDHDEDPKAFASGLREILLKFISNQPKHVMLSQEDWEDALTKLTDITDELKHSETIDEVDEQLTRLYDWGDTPILSPSRRWTGANMGWINAHG